MNRMALAMVVALASACAMMGHKDEKSAAVATQEQAGQNFQKAADAQKRATDEEAKAESADKDVEQAQKALADAQAKARGQHAKAQQAQDEARQLAQQASQQGTQQQEQATQLQQEQVQSAQQKVQQNQSWTQEKHLRGQVLTADGDNLKVRSHDGKDLALSVSDTTNVLVNGKQGSTKQIQPGDEVRASYQMVQGKAQALQIDVTSNAQGAQSDTSSSGSSSQK